MAFPTLLIVNSNPEFCKTAAEHFSAFAVTEYCHSGPHALELLQAHHHHLLLIDLALPHMDGITVLRMARQAGISPAVMVMMDHQSPYISAALASLGISYAVLKPCPMDMLAAHMQDIAACTDIAPATVHTPTPEDATAELLLRLGLRRNLSGFPYLKVAIPLFAAEPDQFITKELYTNVGKRFGKRGTLIERSIRNAIETAWAEADPAIWRQYFPDCPDSRPTNRSFITRMAQILFPQSQQNAG